MKNKTSFYPVVYVYEYIQEFMELFLPGDVAFLPREELMRQVISLGKKGPAVWT